jgi:geminin
VSQINTFLSLSLCIEEASLAYWKELAENRRKALQEALEENENLHTRISDLEKENEMLEEMVQEAKTIAEVISVRAKMIEDFILNPKEST